MLNENSVQAVDSARWCAGFTRPLYDSYCFSRVPATVETILTGTSETPPLPADVLGDLPARHDKVVVFLIDAFGWRFYEQYRDSVPLLRRIAARGVVSKMTSMFPSTTAVHVTCMHTGLPIRQSGICEWYHYHPESDRIVAPLLFSLAGAPSRDSLGEIGVQPSDLLPPSNFYTRLAERGVTSHVFQNAAYVRSAYSKHVCRGANLVSYLTMVDGLWKLRRAVTSDSGPAYYFFYFDKFDATCHKYGPDAPSLARVARNAFGAIDRHFVEPLRRRDVNVLTLFTADHGQVAVDPHQTVYLDRECPELSAALRPGADGLPLTPAGSSRDFFLYPEPDRLDSVREQIEEVLAGRAEVFTAAELEEEGMFGSGPAANGFHDRMGTLIAAPRAGEMVYWAGPDGRFEQQFRGHHGGLTSEEMETLFMVLPL